ncbi:hypothetical protein CHLNCDRAFT_142045 [Chlorella variabilis]|uniref:Peptidase A2 domain-containing protein n=1 Tax=Chlorella variabilis TaxID=554065 RepID=E1Z7M3_CHLVA|nr:hypothetical protein CHLNCDRAFT_142045 [Chlorella variabilis]EFN58196.1 hypothetical protein CHLNCDRAFT_142045 [Chlorella variabilis]|eukprot:XP_005850298.1 hypothetical protein CHLNCDRAFT_142045 [Chlorella variabilis]
MEWQLAFDRRGSFLESLASPQMSYSWGYAAAAADGAGTSSNRKAAGSTSNSSTSSGSGSGGGYFGTAGVCWASDDAGCPRVMQLDDEEALLLSTWVRTGTWVLPRVAAHLHIAAVAAPAQKGTAKAAKAQGGSTAWVELRLRGGGQVVVWLELCTTSWLPRSMRLRLAGDEEVWELSDWREWQPGLWLAGTATQSSSEEGGVMNTYHACSVTLQDAPLSLLPAMESGGASSSGSSGGSRSSSGSRFTPPQAPLMPDDSSFLPGVPEEVPAWYTISGHSLVQPLLDGRPVGYFIFDTGASGFVLDPAVAEALGLEAFGELQVTSMVGKVASRFRRAASFQLGPLRIERPLLMELPCTGLVAGLPEGGRVAGIVGHDVLRRALVHMPPHPRRAPSREAAAADAAVDSPAAALAASMSTARLRRTPLQFTLRLQHPAAADDGNSDAAVPGVQASSPAAASSAGSSSSAGGKTAATAAAAGSAEAAGPAEPEAESSSSPGNGSSSSSSSSRSSNKPSAAPPRRSSATRAGRRSQGVARGAGGVRQQQEPRWLPLVMVAGLPHVELELVSASGRRHSGLFMLDSGAGGFDVIVNPKAARSLQLGQGSAAAGGGTTHIKGIGSGASDRLTAQRCQLAEARLGATTLSPVTAVFHSGGGSGGGGGAGLSLSQHTSGIVCAGLLGRCSLLFDYARMRMAVLGGAER